MKEEIKQAITILCEGLEKNVMETFAYYVEFIDNFSPMQIEKIQEVVEGIFILIFTLYAWKFCTYISHVNIIYLFLRFNYFL